MADISSDPKIIAAVDEARERVGRSIRCATFFKNIEEWENSVALGNIDRANVLCDFLESYFKEAREAGNTTWDDYWIELGTFAISWNKTDIITIAKNESFGKYANTCMRFTIALKDSRMSEEIITELRETAFALLRTCPYNRNIRYLEEIIADGLDDKHLSVEVLTKYSQKYTNKHNTPKSGNIDDLLLSVNKGDIASADRIINGLTPDGLKNLMERLHESPNHNTGGKYRGE